MAKKTKDSKIKNKAGFVILIAICIVLAGVLSFKFYVKYKEANSFDFDLVSPEGYFTDLSTSEPE